MAVRPLTQADAEAFRALRLRGLREEPDPFLSTYDEEQAWPVERTRAHLGSLREAEADAVLGAFEGGVLVGALGVARERQRKARHLAKLWGMYVAPEARGRGHGRALLDAALERLRGVPGVEQVHLTVITTDEAARRLYQRAGFTVVGLLRGAMKDGDRYLDEELMVCRLACAPG
jgi:ribosomal protein S18 acetylase RimI-like enzyme